MVHVKNVTSRAGFVHLFKHRSGLNRYLIAVCINPEGTFDVIYNALEIHVWRFRQSGKSFVLMVPFLKAIQDIPNDKQLSCINWRDLPL